MSTEVSPLHSMDESDDSGSDYEATFKTTKRKKMPTLQARQPPKRPRRKTAERMTPSPYSHPGPSSVEPSLQPSQGTSRLPPQKRMISAKEIFEAVCSGKSAMVTVVDEWLDIYKHSREDGLLVLINFIVQSCGCKGAVSREMLDNLQNAEIVHQLTKDFQRDLDNYPLCATGQQQKKFIAGFCEFARVLVHSCRNSLVYDEYIFPSILSLLTGLSDSQVRAFRHTSTLLAIKLTTGLVELSVNVSIQLQTTQRQFDMENSKRLTDRASDKLEELKATISEITENREELASIIGSTFHGIFINRYRDLLPEIRAACIEELGTWIKVDPEYFLNDSYLKYLGWTLHDKQSVVRLQCVKALQGLYQEREFIGRLELFTNRFKERILSMVMDKELDIAVEVIHLLLQIHQNIDGGLGEEECGHMYTLVYAADRSLASAAAVFLYHKLRSLIATEDPDNEITNAAFIHILLFFFVQSDLHEHATYLVDSLWTVAGSELRDWDAMTTFLLQDSDLQYENEEALIEVMMCAMKQASQSTPPVGRTQGKKLQSVRQNKIQEQDRRRITNHFIPLLPQLLTKYSAETRKVSLLLAAPLYFDLEMYSSSPYMEKHLDLLLAEICGIVLKHSETTVLNACATLVGTLCSNSFTFSSRTHRAIGQLMDSLTECFGNYFSDLQQASADEDDIYIAATALKRIAALSSAKDPTHWQLFQPCMELMQSQRKSGAPDKELMVSALRCAAHHLMWAKVRAAETVLTEADVQQLNKQVRSFCRFCEKCLSAIQADIRNMAFETLCDLLLIYSETSEMQSLVYLSSDSLRAEMGAFLVDYIFSDSDGLELSGEDEEEQKIMELQRKRNQLAGFCRLTLYGVLDITAATDVFKYYHKYYNDFGDIIKETLSQTKRISPVLSAKNICLSLQQLFSEMLTEEKQDFESLQNLAKRLASTFGVHVHSERQPLMTLHMDGIDFALRAADEGCEEETANVSFLLILCKFSLKLLQKDRIDLASFFKAKCPAAAFSWPPVQMYQRSLEGRLSKVREREDEGATSPAQRVLAPKPKRNTAQRETESTAVTSATTDSSMDDSSVHSMLHTPVMTSTILKKSARPAPSRPASILESDDENVLTEPETEESFFSGFQMRRVKPTSRRMSTPSPAASSSNQHAQRSLHTRLPLIEDEEEPEEADIDHNDTDDEGNYTLPSTRHTSLSVLDELFDEDGI